MVVWQPPTAHRLLPEAMLTAASTQPDVVGVVVGLHDEPFHLIAYIRSVRDMSACTPTAHTSLDDTTTTPRRPATLRKGVGLAIWVH